MPSATTATESISTVFTAKLLDGLEAARNADAAMREVDRCRRLIAGDSVFSIQRNVTTERDAVDEIRLRRFYSSVSEHYPVNGAKRKTLTPWTECLFIQGRVFVGEGEETLASHFDDFDQMRPYGLRSVINVPLLHGNLCYATFNVFGTRAHWLPQEVLGIRLLALAAARWVPRAIGLSYRFAGASLTHPLEA
jgi:hypothetical protein